MHEKAPEAVSAYNKIENNISRMKNFHYYIIVAVLGGVTLANKEYLLPVFWCLKLQLLIWYSWPHDSFVGFMLLPMDTNLSVFAYERVSLRLFRRKLLPNWREGIDSIGLKHLLTCGHFF
jgi:hypothetical protein